MQCLTFINATDGCSGKVASVKARTVIRAHVMRKHWVERSGLIQPGPEKLAAQRRKTINQQAYISTSTDQAAHPDDTAPPHDEESLLARVDTQGTSSQGMCLSRHLNRLNDDFVYAGSSIDLESYGQFSHYSSEFSVILPNSIQPLPLKKASTSCLIAIHQNSPILLEAICFMAAFHECMKRTKDSCGRLVTAFSDKRIIRYKTGTIQKLNNHLMKQDALVTEADILCVTILLFSESVVGDRMAVNAHLFGLIRMVELYGGQPSLSPIIETHLQFVTLLAAQLDQLRPILPLKPAIQDRYGRVSRAPFPPQSDFLSECGVGYALFSQYSGLILSDHLQQVLCYMVHVITRVERVQKNIKVLEGEWMDDVLALEHVLISLPHEKPLNQLEECIRLTALVYCNTALWRLPLYFRWVMSLVEHLKSALLSLRGWIPPDLHFWMLFMGRQACTLEFSLTETAWWNVSITQVADELDVSSWEEARHVFQEFFYVERMHAVRWKAVWIDVLSGTRSEEPIVRDPEHPCEYM